MGELCDSVIRGLMKELQRLADISEVETHQLHHLFTLVLSQVPTLFVVTKEKDKVQMPVAKFIISWERFARVTELLDARLSDISQLYDNGSLSEFSDAELNALVSALFADTPKRADLLKKISQ